MRLSLLAALAAVGALVGTLIAKAVNVRVWREPILGACRAELLINDTFLFAAAGILLALAAACMIGVAKSRQPWGPRAACWFCATPRPPTCARVAVEAGKLVVDLQVGDWDRVVMTGRDGSRELAFSILKGQGISQEVLDALARTLAEREVPHA